MGSQGLKLLLTNIVGSNWTAIGAHFVILVFHAPVHMLQLLSNAITVFLFDELKQTESTLNVLSE